MFLSFSVFISYLKLCNLGVFDKSCDFNPIWQPTCHNESACQKGMWLVTRCLDFLFCQKAERHWVEYKTHCLDMSKTTVSVAVDLAVPLIHSVAWCRTGFHPSHHSGMDLDCAAASKEGKKWPPVRPEKLFSAVFSLRFKRLWCSMLFTHSFLRRVSAVLRQ